MIERRDFLKGSVAAVSILALGRSGKAFASEDQKFAGIIYTKDNPGRWAGKEGIHTPEISLAGNMVTIKTTKHPMTPEHFIVRHTLVLGDGTVVGGTTFTAADTPQSSYELPAGYKGKIFATSFCNQHDFWLNEAEV